jgi:DHA2 family multidrug resistance protein-like MFS transporter
VSNAQTSAAWKPNDKWLIGIVLAVINFWLFAQTLLNVIPGIQGELGIERTIGNLAVSITSLFSGIFIVVAGGLADRLGRVKLMYAGIYLSILGSLLIALTPENLGGLTSALLLGGRIVQGLSAACIMPSTMALLRGTPESKAESAGPAARFDFGGLAAFIIALVAINVYISQGPSLGWLSLTGVGLVAISVVSALAFFSIESRKEHAFLDLRLFGNMSFTGATLSNFLLNGAAGTLIVALGLVQVAAGLSSLQSGLLTLGYLISVIATIRVGEKLLQRFGPRRPMIWGSAIAGLGILLTSMTFVLVEQYIVLAVIGFTLFGVGLGFYATPSTDAALSSVPDNQAGAAAGIYKMASSLGNAIGVAVSAALYVAAQAANPDMIRSWGLFIGNQENVGLRFGGAVGVLFNLLMVVIAIISIMVTVPREKQKTGNEVPATPSIGA